MAWYIKQGLTNLSPIFQVHNIVAPVEWLHIDILAHPGLKRVAYYGFGYHIQNRLPGDLMTEIFVETLSDIRFRHTR